MTDVTADQQAMWDALGILGFDLNGDPTPAASLVSGGRAFRERFIAMIHEHRADYDAATDAPPVIVQIKGPSIDPITARRIREEVRKALA